MTQSTAANEPGLTRLVVLPRHAGLRLDVFIAAVTELSRRGARRLIGDGMVVRNQHVVKVSSRELEAGDVVDLLVPPSAAGVPALPEISATDILFEDRWLLVAHKPAGVLSQPAERDEAELSFDQMVLRFVALREGRRLYLRLVHRIDRLTSGAVVFARNPQAQAPLAEAWSSNRVKRFYLAVVQGHPGLDEITVDEPVARDSRHHWKFRVSEDGREARTHVEVLQRDERGHSVVRCQLLTGRTHQVRVHLAHLGHPVLGDRLYGACHTAGVERPLLHAAGLVLPHPRSGKRLSIDCPVPEDMAAFIP